MASQQTITVRGNGGLRGELLDSPPFPRDQVRVRLLDGRELHVPAAALIPEADGSYYLSLGPADVPPQGGSIPGTAAQAGETVVPVVAEELIVGKQVTATGGVRVHKRVEQHDEMVDVPLTREQVDIRRVIINRDVDAPQPVRYEGDTTIIPLVEEVLVVEKRLRLKEELYITRRRTEERRQQKVTLEREVADVRRLDEHGREVGRADVVEEPVVDSVAGTTTTPIAPAPEKAKIRRNRVIRPE